MGMILGTGGDDCVDLCASLFRVCRRYGARDQKSRATNDRSGGSRVLVAGIVMISTVGGAIVREGTARDSKGQRQCTRMGLMSGF